MESPAAAPRDRLRRFAPGALLLLALLWWCARTLLPHVNACAGGSDSAGYLTEARFIASGRIHVPPRTLAGLNANHFNEFLYSPLGLKPADGELIPTYPFGLPLLIAGTAAVTGWARAANVVIVGHALLALVFVYAFARRLGLGWRGAITACVSLAVCPLFLYFSVQAMSDVPALTWTAATAWAAWRARERRGWAILTGVFLSLAVLIRPTNVLMAVPLLVAWWPDGKCAGLCCLGGLPGAIACLAYNQAAYGSPFTTGYGEAGTLFQWAVVHETLVVYRQWFPALFTRAIFLFVLLPFRMGRQAAFLLAWAAVYLVFYGCYYHTHEAWWFLRFLLPAVPALLVGWIWGARTVVAALSRGGPAPGWARTAAMALLVVGIWRVETKWDRRLYVLDIGESEGTYPLAMDWLKAYAPANSVLLCMQTSGAAYYYTPFTLLRWDEIDRAKFGEVLRAAAATGRPLYAPLFPFEEQPALRERLPGLWRPVTRIRAVTIWQWAGDGRTR